VTTLFKDQLAGPEVERIALAIKSVEPGFPRHEFVALATDGLTELELKNRVRHIIDALHRSLPEDFREAATILRQLPDLSKRGESEDVFRGFSAWPLIDYVGVAGTGHPDVALPLLKQLTPLFSAEFAIRPFLDEDLRSTIAYLSGWATDPDHHVRRLVSEGCRPRLPWGVQLKQLIADPRPILPLLEALKDDTSEYVRRSVANNLNDIAKDHPDLIVSICERWYVGASASRKRLIRHALRTLIKDGHPSVFPLLGFTAEPSLGVGIIKLDQDRIELGEDLRFELDLTSLVDQQHFVVDFAVHFVKANGDTVPKVFKLKNVKADAGERVVIKKKHPIKPITTRRYYSGVHHLAVHVNGREIARTSFVLDV
jgi:3-methyladenine DNA glycosylase AlkC